MRPYRLPDNLRALGLDARRRVERDAVRCRRESGLGRLSRMTDGAALRDNRRHVGERHGRYGGRRCRCRQTHCSGGRADVAGFVLVGRDVQVYQIARDLHRRRFARAHADNILRVPPCLDEPGAVGHVDGGQRCCIQNCGLRHDVVEVQDVRSQGVDFVVRQRLRRRKRHRTFDIVEKRRSVRPETTDCLLRNVVLERTGTAGNDRKAAGPLAEFTVARRALRLPNLRALGDRARSGR